MSHEVNNSICAINSILQSFNDIQPEDEDFHEALKIAMNRNHRLVKFMSNFAEVVKVPLPHLELANLHSLIKGLIRLMETEYKKRRVELELIMEEEAMQVSLDVEQFEQVMVNVLKNAVESVEKEGKVKIVLSSRGLKVLDNGRGISTEAQKKLFSPFYSTKPQGQGIGMMLVREILRNHHFPYSLQTRKDGWTLKEMPVIDQVWYKMLAEHPDAAIMEVHPPVSPASSILATINPDPETYWKIDYRYFNQYSLQELPVDHILGRYQEATAADKLLRMNYDIHTGAIMGLPGKILAFFTSLLCASLPVTGFMIWWGRRNKEPKKHKKPKLNSKNVAESVLITMD